MSEPSALRFSLRVLLMAVAIVALGAFALRSASEMWVGIVMTLTLGVLVFAVLAAIYRQGAARAFWVGLAVCGWGYMLCVFGPPHTAGGNLSRHLLMTRLLEYAAKETAPTVTSPATSPAPTAYYAPRPLAPAPRFSQPSVPPRISTPPTTPKPFVQPRIYTPPTAPMSLSSVEYQIGFTKIGQALWAMLFGFVGGIVARVLYSKRQAAEA